MARIETLAQTKKLKNLREIQLEDDEEEKDWKIEINQMKKKKLQKKKNKYTKRKKKQRIFCFDWFERS